MLRSGVHENHESALGLLHPGAHGIAFAALGAVVDDLKMRKRGGGGAGGGERAVVAAFDDDEHLVPGGEGEPVAVVRHARHVGRQAAGFPKGRDHDG